MLQIALVVLAIRQPGIRPPNPPVYVVGEIRHLDLEAGKVEIRKEGHTGVTRYRLDPKTRYFFDSKSAKAAELVIGTKVTLQLDLTTDLVIAIGGGLGMPDVREVLAKEAKQQIEAPAAQPRKMAGIGAAPPGPRRHGLGRAQGSPPVPFVRPEPTPEGTIRPPTLWLEFDDDELAASQRYKGTVVRLYGSVSVVKNAKNGQLYIGFDTVDDSAVSPGRHAEMTDVEKRRQTEGWPPGILCYLNEPGKAGAAKVAKGDKVIVSGKIVGRRSDKDAAKGYVVVLEACTVEK